MRQPVTKAHHGSQFSTGQETESQVKNTETDEIACRDLVMATYARRPIIWQPQSAAAWGHFSLLPPSPSPRSTLGERTLVVHGSIFSDITAEMPDPASTSHHLLPLFYGWLKETSQRWVNLCQHPELCPLSTVISWLPCRFPNVEGLIWFWS